jgi:hypothetical protein
MGGDGLIEVKRLIGSGSAWGHANTVIKTVGQ